MAADMHSRLMLSFELWELHEAFFTLTEWPMDIVAVGLDSVVSKKIKRGVIYAAEKGLEIKKLKAADKRLFDEIELAVKNGEIWSHSENLGLRRMYESNISYLVPSHAVIVWFLLKGKKLPCKLQEELQLFPLHASTKKCHHDNVRIQTVALYLLENGEATNVSYLLNHELMRKYGTLLTAQGGKKDENNAHRRAINELFYSSGKKGRPEVCALLKKDDRRPYCMEIPRVRQISSGRVCYNFPLLKTTVEALSKIYIHILGPELLDLTEYQFSVRVFSATLARALLNEASKNVVNLAKRVCLATLRERYVHPKMNSISPGLRAQLKIGQLQEKNKQFCFEPFLESHRRSPLSEEEKRMFEEFFGSSLSW